MGGLIAFYVFTGILFSVGPSGGVIVLSYVFTGILFSVGPPGGRNLIILRFYGHSLFSTTSGGPIFRCTTKDRGERRAKGLQSRPLDSGFLYGGSEGRRAYSVRVRIGAINAI